MSKALNFGDERVRMTPNGNIEVLCNCEGCRVSDGGGLVIEIIRARTAAKLLEGDGSYREDRFLLKREGDTITVGCTSFSVAEGKRIMRELLATLAPEATR